MNGNYEVKWSEPGIVEQAGVIKRTKLLESVTISTTDGFVVFSSGGMTRLVIPSERLISVEAVNV